MKAAQILHEAREKLDVHFILGSNFILILFWNFATVASSVEDFHEEVVEHGGGHGAETSVVVGWVDVTAEALSLFGR